MILSTLTKADRFYALHPLFARAFDFLRSTDLLALASGKHAVQGEEIFAIVEACPARARRRKPSWNAIAVTSTFNWC